jgi:hypothetical protein
MHLLLCSQNTDFSIKIFLRNTWVRCQGLMPVILAAWEAEIGRIEVRGQPGQIVLKTPSPKAKWAGAVAQLVECPEFKPQSHQKKKKVLKG